MKPYFKPGMTVLFQGDSVTDCGRERDPGCETIQNMGNGYPLLVKNLYDMIFPDNDIRFVNRGVSGDRIRNLLARYDEDFKAVKPDFISILIGINDTWRAFDAKDPTSAERFHDEYEQLLKQLKADFPQAKILMIEQFAFIAHPDRLDWSEDLDPKRAVTRQLAEKYADYFIPIYDCMKNAAESDFDMYALSADGVHPAYTGHMLIATEILKTLEII